MGPVQNKRRNTRSRRDIGEGWVHAWIPTVVQSTISFAAQLGQPIPARAANLSKQTANVNVGAADGESIDRPIGRGIPSGVRGAIAGQIQFRKIGAVPRAYAGKVAGDEQVAGGERDSRDGPARVWIPG